MKAISLYQIEAAVSDAYGVSAEDLRGPGLKRRVWFPRHVAMYLARDLTTATVIEIAGHFQKHAGRVSDAHRHVSRMVDRKDGKAALVNALRAKLVEDAYGRAA